jgi:peptidoglycan/xylan/chitin deacetylase (PgdA/CDA1 family)
MPKLRGDRDRRTAVGARTGIPRRAFLGTGLAAGVAAVLAACDSGGDDGTGALDTTTTAPAVTTPTSSTAPPTTVPAVARFTDHGSRTADTKKRVALTFHTNGDLRLAGELLDLLAARQTVITAFVVGDWLDANPSWGRRLVEDGHEIANHTYTHPSFLALSHDAMLAEITRCRDVLTRATGTAGTLFRPSGTDDGTVAPPPTVLSVAAEAGYPTVLGFDVDPFDYQDPGAEAVAQRTLAAVGPGAIVSLHFGHTGTVAAMPAILDGLAQRDLTPVTASKLLA